jgi:uncharacterized membrane protein
LEPADRPVTTIFWFLCSVATLILFAACLYFKVAWGPLASFGFVGVLITALGLTLIAYILLGLVVAAVMIFEDRRQARKMDKFMDGVMDRVEARMRSRRDKGGN